MATVQVPEKCPYCGLEDIRVHECTCIFCERSEKPLCMMCGETLE